MTIQWYAPPTALVGLGTSLYIIVVADRVVGRTKSPVMMLMWSTTPVPVNRAMFRPDHIVLLPEHPAVLHTVIDVNDSTATCDHDRCAAAMGKMRNCVMRNA